LAFNRTRWHSVTEPVLPKYIWVLAALYFIASLAHFAHNAEYIAFYPGVPTWLTAEMASRDG